ncbi:unnamed protein product, partial [marine sediment metagenome]
EGYGINNPVQGQLWFNTSTSKMMTFDGTNWNQSGGTYYNTTEPSANPSDGDLWFDVNYFGSPGLGQLLIYNDGGWESVADHYIAAAGGTMTGYLTLVGPPTMTDHAATMGYVDTAVGDFLPLAGGTMDAGANIVVVGMTLGGFDGDITTGPDIDLDSQGLIVADSNLRLHIDGNNDGSGTFVVSKAAKVSPGQTDLFQIASTNGMLRELTNATTYATAVSDDR